MNAPRKKRQNRRRSNQTTASYDTSVPSPCVAVCTFDGAPFCQGCYRTIDEIREWMVMTRQQKLQVLDNIEVRRSQ